MARIDLSNRFSQAFGIVGAAQSASTILVRKNGDYKFEKFDKSVDSDFEDVTFKIPSAFPLSEDTVLKFASLPFIRTSNASGIAQSENVLAPPPILMFSKEKKLIITPINEDDVEVIERWNSDAWEVKIQGLLIDASKHRYPTTLVERIVRLFEHNNVVGVTGTQFYEKGIDFIYLKNIEVTGVVGYEDTVQYSITARAIKDVGFKLTS
jgi:Domain of unknown function (DUF6046)